MLYYIKIVWAFVKKYWEVFLFLAGALVTLLLLNRQKESFFEDMKKIQDAHDEEVKQINNARLEERKKHEENLKLLETTLKNIQLQYDTYRMELDAKKKREIQQIVKDHGSDPVGLAKKLSEATGFTVVLPS